MRNRDDKIKEANMVSNGYLDAAKYLKMCENNDGLVMGMYAPAYTANLALACELYFKQILMIRKIHIKHEHELKGLFKKIPHDIKLKIEEKYNEKMQVKFSECAIQSMTLDECLDKYNTAFEDWRYTYEGGKKANTIAEVHFFVLVDVAKMITDEMVEQHFANNPVR